MSLPPISHSTIPQTTESMQISPPSTVMPMGSQGRYAIGTVPLQQQLRESLKTNLMLEREISIIRSQLQEVSNIKDKALEELQKTKNILNKTVEQLHIKSAEATIAQLKLSDSRSKSVALSEEIQRKDVIISLMGKEMQRCKDKIAELQLQEG